jgi:hypothetical protein
VIADEVRRDSATGKHAIIGTFDVICSPKFPCRHPQIAAYLAITGGHGDVPVTMRLVDVDETRPAVFSCSSILHFADPMQVLEHALTLHGPAFPEPGEYRLQFCVAGELICERRLKLRQVPPRNPRPEGDANH